MSNAKSRIPGICKGKVEMSKDFDEPLSFYEIDDLKNNSVKNTFLRLAKKERYLATGSLYEFFKAAWPYIEGNMPYVDSWHIRAIAEHLEAVYARQIKKLIINVPPRNYVFSKHTMEMLEKLTNDE